MEEKLSWVEYRCRSNLPESIKRWAYENPTEAVQLIREELAIREVQRILNQETEPEVWKQRIKKNG